MAAEHDKLRETLHQLQGQLDALREIDPETAGQLDATINEAKAALAGGTIHPHNQQSIVQRLSDSVLEFEAEHPALAGNLGSIIDALGRMGI